MGSQEENHEPQANNYIPADHDYGYPGRKKIHNRQSNVRRGVEQFVRRRVQIGPQNGFLLQHPGQEPIDGIGDRGGDEGEEGPAIEMVQKENNKQWNAENSAYAQKIRNIDHVILAPGCGRISFASTPSSPLPALPSLYRLFPPQNKNLQKKLGRIIHLRRNQPCGINFRRWVYSAGQT